MTAPSSNPLREMLPNAAGYVDLAHPDQLRDDLLEAAVLLEDALELLTEPSSRRDLVHWEAYARVVLCRINPDQEPEVGQE